MSLKRIYRTLTTFLLLGVFAWNIAGWLATGLISLHDHHMHAGDHTCEMALCFCETDSEDSICKCHHSELHAKNGMDNSDFHMDVIEHSESDHHKSVCYYSSPHDTPDGSFSIVIWDNYKTYYSDHPAFNTGEIITSELLAFSDIVLSGFLSRVLRPPSV